jgi:hypothetical protein
MMAPETHEVDHGELRYALRYAGSELAQLEFKLYRDNQGAGLPAQVYDFTSRGFAIRLPSGIESESMPHVGENVTLVYAIPDKAAWHFTCTVAHSRSDTFTDSPDGVILGLRRTFNRSGQQGLMEMRQVPRFALPTSLGLIATSLHPLLYGHQTRLRLVDVNLGMGYCLETEDPLFLVTEGSPLQLHFTLPGMRSADIQGKVTWVQIADKHRLRLGLQTFDMPFELYQALCRLLLHSQVLSPSLLREAGFYVRHVREDIRFRQASRLEDYAAILMLRHACRLDSRPKVGKEDGPSSPESMALESDGHSRILTAWHGDRLIGTMALFFPQTLAAGSDFSDCVKQGAKAFALPMLTDCIEMRQLCIADDFRGTDVLQGLFEQSMKAFLLSDRAWFLTAAPEEQVGFYLGMGLKHLGEAESLSHAYGRKVHILCLHREDIWQRRGISLWMWVLTYGELAEYARKRGVLRASRWLKFRLYLRLCLRPLAQHFFGQRLLKAYRHHLAELRHGQAASETRPLRPAPAADWVPVKP